MGPGVINAQNIFSGRDSIFVTGNLLQQPPAAIGIAALHQIPPPPADFTGRKKELTTLRTAIEGGAIISGLVGMGGVGKTTLALRLADELKSDYPDAQLYLDLRGVDPEPVSPILALQHFIRAFEPQALLPNDLVSLRAIFQSALDGKRVILLLDNAKDGEQISSLIPPNSCHTIVTSRISFVIPGLKPHNVDPMGSADATSLLLKIAPRIGESAPQLASMLGNLPLALRLAAGVIAVRLNITPEDYLKRLSDAHNRLELVEASIQLSYNFLDNELKALWRALGVFSDGFDILAVANIWDRHAESSLDALSILIQMNLVDFDISKSRYYLHNLTRDFARARLNENKNAVQISFSRHSSYYLKLLREIGDLFLNGGHSIDLSLYIFDLESINIEDGQQWAADNASHNKTAANLCMEYPVVAAAVVGLRMHPLSNMQWLQSAISVAERLRRRDMLVLALGNLGVTYAKLSQYHKAVEIYKIQIKLLRRGNDIASQSTTMGNLGVAYTHLGKTEQAVESFQKSLQLACKIGDRRSEGNALGNLGSIYMNSGNISQALNNFQIRLDIAREIGDQVGEAGVLINIGTAHSLAGDFNKALAFFEEGLYVFRTLGDQRSEGLALCNLGNILFNIGQIENAENHYKDGLLLAQMVGNPEVEKQATWNLGLIRLTLGEKELGIKLALKAIQMADEMSLPDADNMRNQLESLLNFIENPVTSE